MSDQWSVRDSERMTRALLGVVDRVERLRQALAALGDNSTDKEAEAIQEIVKIIQTRTFKLVYTALIKSGKSTAINVAMRCSLLPEDILPETSCVVSILHSPPGQTPVLQTLQGQELAHGEDAIFAFVKSLNEYLRCVAKGEDVSRFRGAFDESMESLQLRAHVPFLEGVAEAGGIQFVLMDTKGVNESHNDHGVDEILLQADVLVFLLDVSRLSSTDELTYLSRILSTRPDIVTHGRIYFLLNKIDNIDMPPEAKQEKIQQAIRLVQDFLHRIHPDFRRAAQYIYPVSTKTYQIAMKAQAGTLSAAENESLTKEILGRRARGVAWVDWRDAQYQEDLREMVDESCYEPVEQMLRDKLTVNAPRLFAEAVVGKITRVAHGLHQQTETRLQAFSISTADTERCIASLQQAIQHTDTLHAQLAALLQAARQRIQSQLLPLADIHHELTRAIHEPASMDYPDPALAQAEQTRALEATRQGLDRVVAMLQARMHCAMESEFGSLRSEVERLREESIRTALLHALRDVLSPEDLDRMGESLRAHNLWPSDTLDIPTIEASLQIDLAPETVVRQESRERASLIPAVYGTRQRTIGGSGSQGPAAASIAAQGATIGAKFGGVGAVVGGALGLLAGVFGSKRAKPVTVSEQVVEQEARLEYHTEQVDVERYQCDVRQYQARLAAVVQQLAQEVHAGVLAHLQRLMEHIQASIQTHFVLHLQETARALQTDLATRQRSAQEAALVQGQLQRIHLALEDLLAHLLHPPEDIVRSSLPPLPEGL